MYNGYGRNTVPRNELKSIQCHHSVCVRACVCARACVCVSLEVSKELPWFPALAPAALVSLLISMDCCHRQVFVLCRCV